MMKKRSWYRPWYIWLGILAFLVLFHVSLHTIDKYETKLKIGYPSQRALARKVWVFFGFFAFVVMMVPSVIIALFVQRALGIPESFLIENWHFIYIYPVSVYANYRHARWREENLSHLMKPKKRKSSDEV